MVRSASRAAVSRGIYDNYRRRCRPRWDAIYKRVLSVSFTSSIQTRFPHGRWMRICCIWVEFMDLHGRDGRVGMMNGCMACLWPRR